MYILTFQSTKSKWFYKKHKKIFENSNNSNNAPTYLIMLYATEVPILNTECTKYLEVVRFIKIYLM